MTEDYAKNVAIQLPELYISGNKDLRLECWFGITMQAGE